MDLPLPTVEAGAVLGSPMGFFRENQALLVLDGTEPHGILTLS